MSRLGWVLVFVGCGLAVCAPAQAAPRRVRYVVAVDAAWQRWVSAARKHLRASEDLLAAANSKGAKAAVDIHVALEKLGDAKRELDSAKGEIRELARHLNEIEQEILADQGPDSDYRRAKNAVEAARKELANLEARLLTEGRYDERKADADNAGEVVKLRNEILSASREYGTTKEKADAAGKELNRVRLDLLREDKDWNAISDALADAHRGEDQAQDKANSAGVSRLAPLKDSRDAEQVAAYAKAHIAASKSLLAQLGAKAHPGKGKKGSNSPGTKSPGIKK